MTLGDFTMVRCIRYEIPLPLKWTCTLTYPLLQWHRIFSAPPNITKQAGLQSELLHLRAILFRIGCSMWHPLHDTREHVTAFPQMKLKLTVNSNQTLSLTMIIWKIKHPNGTNFTASAISPVHVLVLPKGTHTSIYRFIPISETYKPTYRVFWLNLPTSYELPWTTKVNSCQSQQTPLFLWWTRVDLRLMQSQKPELQGNGELKGRQNDEPSKKDMRNVYQLFVELDHIGLSSFEQRTEKKMVLLLGEYLKGIDTIVPIKFTKIHAMIYQDKTLSIWVHCTWPSKTICFWKGLTQNSNKQTSRAMLTLCKRMSSVHLAKEITKK